MHYIKCNECGHFNEVKSEYLVFCAKCNKKLDNNFPDWKKKNPGRGFDDYKRLVCVTEEAINTSPVKVKTRPKGLKYWVGFAVAFAIFYAIGQFGGESIVRFIKSQQASREIISQDWQKERYGDFGLVVETPFKLEKTELPVPDNLKHMIDIMDTYSASKSQGFGVMINSVRYKPEIGSVNLEGAANGSIAEMKMQPGVSAFTYSEDLFSKNDIPGFIQKGSYSKEGNIIEFINTGFANGLILYQVMVAYNPDDKDMKAMALRVIESIEIDNLKIIQI
jgi:hypothetical protein